MAPLIDLRPLLSGTLGSEILVGGVRIGEGVGLLALSEEITGAEEAASSTEDRLVHTKGSVFRQAPDGSLIEISLRSRVEAVVAKGGTLWLGQVSVRVEQGRVQRVFVRGGPLDGLAVRSESDIVGRFGVPSGIDRSLGARDYHYVERQLVVGWSTRENRLEYVALGPDPWVEPRRGAEDLLAELLWSFDKLAEVGWREPNDGALRTRFRRIAALARALGIGEPRGVAQGDFLDSEVSDGRQRVLLEIARTAVLDASRASFPVQAYQRLLAHRLKAEHVIGFNRSVLECSIPVLAGVLLQQERVAEALRASLSVVDGWLCRLFDPEGRTFTESELIKHYGWPDIDVRHQEAAEAWGE